jgi:predicted DNA-binding protein
MANDEPVRVWLSQEVKAALKRRADDTYRPVSLYVRMLIERDLDENIGDEWRADKGLSGPGRGHS